MLRAGQPLSRENAQPLGDLAETLGRLLRNTVFRLSLVGALLFGVSLLVAQAIVYYQIVQAERVRIEDDLQNDLRNLSELFTSAGDTAIKEARGTLLPGPNEPLSLEDVERGRLIGDLASRSAVSQVVTLRDVSPDIYSMFVFKGAATGKLVTPDIAARGIESPELAEFLQKRNFRQEAIASVTDQDTGQTEERRIVALGQAITEDGEDVGVIMVGRDVENIVRTGERTQSAMLLSSLIALFLGILSSIFVARRFANRVEQFNAVAVDVRAGNLDRRAPRNYSEDEMDMLAEHLNGMLDHIDRLMQAMRYAGDSVAHDLRTPLTRLRTRLETAAVEAGEGEAADTLWAAAGDADELLSTFDSVLRIARLEAGEKRDLLKPVDPKPLLDDLAELYEPACEDAGLEFTHDIEGGLTVLADRGLLSQAVSNLIENAIKYTPPGAPEDADIKGRIHLHVFKGARGRVHISVADDGPGIPLFDRERVRERFVRLDKSRTLPGSGLGLALVDAVAEMHKAELVLGDGLGMDAAVSDGEGTERPGLRVDLIFPRVKAASKPADTPSESLPQAAE